MARAAAAELGEVRAREGEEAAARNQREEMLALSEAMRAQLQSEVDRLEAEAAPLRQTEGLKDAVQMAEEQAAGTARSAGRGGGACRGGRGGGGARLVAWEEEEEEAWEAEYDEHDDHDEGDWGSSPERIPRRGWRHGGGGGGGGGEVVGASAGGGGERGGAKSEVRSLSSLPPRSPSSPSPLPSHRHRRNHPCSRAHALAARALRAAERTGAQLSQLRTAWAGEAEEQRDALQAAAKQHGRTPARRAPS